jgi:hypothetical protein
MGHWSEALVDEIAIRVGAQADRDEIREMARHAASEIELLAGRSFGSDGRTTFDFDAGGYPFTDIPDLQLDSWGVIDSAWPIVDPVNPTHATILQVAALEGPANRAAPVGG